MVEGVNGVLLWSMAARAGDHPRLYSHPCIFWILHTAATLASAIFLFVPAMGQAVPLDSNPPTDEHRRLILENTRKVKLGLAIEPIANFAGEAPRLTLSVRNPTNEPLQVLDPFAAASRRLELDQWGDTNKDGFNHWEPLESYGIQDLPIPWDAPTLTLAPGQKLERQTLWGADRCIVCAGFDSLGMPPSEPGTYKLEYCAGGSGSPCAVVGFSISTPLERESATVQLPGPDAKYAQSLIIQVRYQYFVVVVRPELEKKDQFQKKSGGSYGESIWTTPIDRITQVTANARDLRMTADPVGTVRIEWQDDGVAHAYCLDRARSSIRSCDPIPTNRLRP